MTVTTTSRSAPRLTSALWERSLILIVLLMMGSASGYVIRVWLNGRDLRLARMAAIADRLDKAAWYFRRHLRHCPVDFPVRLELADILRRRDPESALMELRTIPMAAPESLAAARKVAAIALELGRDYDALGPLLLLQERLPQDPNVQLALAEIRFRERNYEAALHHAQRRRELQPTQVDAYLLIAESLDELKRPADMVEPLQAALKLEPELAQAHLNLAYAFQFIGRNDDALEHVQWFLKRHHKTASAHRLFALIERSLGHPEEALAAVRRALDLQPRNLDAALLEVELLLFLRRSEEAFQRASAIASQVGDEQRVLVLQAQAAVLSGRTDKAQQLQSRLNRLIGDD